MPLRKRLTIAALILAALALAAWTTAWWIVAGAVERGILAWADAQRAQGGIVEYRDLAVGGFPLKVRATAGDVRVAARGLDWRGKGVVAEAPLWQPSRIEVTLPGDQRLEVTPKGGPALDIATGNGGVGSVLVDKGKPLEGTFTFSGVTLAPDTPGRPTFKAAGLDVALTQPAEPPADHQQTGLGLTLTAHELALPGAPPALGSVVRRATTALRVQGRPPQIDPDSLAAWSRDGGTVEVDSAMLDWGPLKLALNGTLALDNELQPLAAMTAEVRGAQQVLAAMQDQLKPNEVNVARSVVALLARPDENGEPVIKAPVTVQQRGLFVGPLKVAAVPVIRW